MLALGQLPAARRQPIVQRLEAGKPRQRGEQPFPNVADLVLDLTLLPARGRRAGDGLEKIMVRQRHKAAIKQALLANEDRFHHRLQIVIDHAQGHAAEEGEGPVMGVEHHFLRFPRIGDDEHLAAESQAEMRDLDGLHDASEFDLLVAPIKLADLARRKTQRNKGLRQGWAGFGRLPTSHEPLHAVVGAAVSLNLQALEQTTRGAALSFGEQPLGPQPVLQRRLERPQHRRGLLAAPIDRFRLCLATLANGWTRQLQVTRNRTDALFADQMTAPDFGNHIHKQHPRHSGGKTG